MVVGLFGSEGVQGIMLEKYIIYENTVIMDALKCIEQNEQGFAIVVGENNVLKGVLTDGDIRRAMMAGNVLTNAVDEIYNKDAVTIKDSDDFGLVTELFKNKELNFLPIVDSNKIVRNVITKKQMHAIFLNNIHADLKYDFSSIDVSIVDHEIYQRPWGYFKTTVLNDYYQSKIICVKPKEKISLQSHRHREEYWIIVHGEGMVQLDQSVIQVRCGNTVFIPIGCLHRITNIDDNEDLIFNEIQIGDYFGEDDIIRYEDDYNRV